MSSDSHLIIVRFGDALPADIGTMLRRRGHRVMEPAQLDDALPDWGRIHNPVLLIDCSRSGTTTERIVRALIQHRRILNCPIVLAGTDPRGVSDLLAHYFPIALALRPPCVTDDIFQALDTVARARDRMKAGSPLFIDPSAMEENDLRGSIERLSSSHSAEVRPGGSSMYESLFTSLQDGGLDLAALRGDALTQPMTFSEVVAAGLAPSDAKSLEMARGFLESLDRAGRRHILRTTVLVGRVMEALQVSPARRDAGAGAALAYAWGFGDEDPELVRQTYLSRRHRDVRTKLTHGLERSAARVDAELGRADIAEIIRCFGALVAHDPLEGISAEVVELSMIVFGAESVARICYQSGWWNPRHAYKVLQRLESGWFGDLPPQVATALAKIVAGAVSERPRSFIVPRRLRTDPRLLALARAHREATLRSDEHRVELADLIPGMRLSRPVETFDGATVLEADLKLDHDLIWRLWRLSAIRPLNGPLVIRLGNEERLHEWHGPEYDLPVSLGAEIDAILASCPL